VKTGLSNQEWATFSDQGYLRLGTVATEDEIDSLRQRIDDIMLGSASLDYDRILMQLDEVEGKSSPGPQSKGHKGATLNYRKIQDLELDPLFLRYLQHPLFQDVCARVYGEGAHIACFRAMFMNKPAGKGHHLQWHQDRWTDLDRDPLITIWTALDPATTDNGCVKIIPGSHKWGLINPNSGSGFLNENQMTEIAEKSDHAYLELDLGAVVLLHNWLLHSSDTNSTCIPRRAFSVCYMDAETQSESGHTFSTVFGAEALSPDTK
jgi:phytanoyl-CoA hydroxylase